MLDTRAVVSHNAGKSQISKEWEEHMGEQTTAVTEAIEQALGGVQKQVEDLQSSYQAVEQAFVNARSGDVGAVVSMLPSLMTLQVSGAALTASVESILRFVGASGQWGGGVATVPVPAEAPAPAPEAPPAERAPEPEPAEAPPAAPSGLPVDISTLSGDLQKLHKKAARFSRVAVQEFLLYKKEEVEKGRESKDLYQRFKEEIDKTREQYDEKFKKIAEHNIDYFYDELVKTLADNDPGAMGSYPYPTPSQN